MRKIIFLPSDLFTREPQANAKPVFQKYPDGTGGFRHEFWSTGRLERAIAEKVLYYIMLEERMKYMDVHQWWLKQANSKALITVNSFESIDSISAIDRLTELYAKHAAGQRSPERFGTWPYAIECLCRDLEFVRGNSY